jgi:hypothetical protein
MSKRKPHNNLAGYVAERRNRVTGAYVAIVDQQLAQAGEIVQAWHIDQDGPEEAGRYLVVCTHHKACTATTSIPKARRLMEDPASFCDRCSAQDRVCRPCQGTGQVGETQDAGGGMGVSSRCGDCDGDGYRRVPCRFCGEPTPWTAINRCTECNVVFERLQRMPAAVLQAMAEVTHPELVVYLANNEEEPRLDEGRQDIAEPDLQPGADVQLEEDDLAHGARAACPLHRTADCGCDEETRELAVDVELSRGAGASPEEGGVNPPDMS